MKVLSGLKYNTSVVESIIYPTILTISPVPEGDVEVIDPAAVETYNISAVANVYAVFLTYPLIIIPFEGEDPNAIPNNPLDVVTESASAATQAPELL
jgi:hypothetical protein